MQSFFGKFFVVGLCWSFSFHVLNEIRHLFWDLGYGFDLKVAKITGTLALIGSFVLTVIIFLLGKHGFKMNASTKKWLFIKYVQLYLYLSCYGSL